MLTSNRCFAVVDVETTGLFPNRFDRIIEIAVVQLDGEGQLLGEFSTLVNPGRDVGPTHIHGIRADDVLEAPRFEEIAGKLLLLFKGCVLVGHNLVFDLAFLAAEFRRMGTVLPPVPALCTLRCARRHLEGMPAHRLENCCAAMGIPFLSAHSALGDARATAKLLQALSARGTLDVVEPDAESIPGEGWPVLSPSGKSLSRDTARLSGSRNRSRIGELLERLPVSSESFESARYAAYLEWILKDRNLTDQEVTGLETLASLCGLSRSDAERIHEGYLEGIVKIAFADGVLSNVERDDIDRVGRLLGISAERTGAFVAGEGSRTEKKEPSRGSIDPGIRNLTVCFTGALAGFIRGEPITRQLAERLATNAGLIVLKTVTKKLDVLVVVDPTTQSTKAKKAREYGTQLVAEAAFWQMIGVQVGDEAPPNEHLSPTAHGVDVDPIRNRACAGTDCFSETPDPLTQLQEVGVRMPGVGEKRTGGGPLAAKVFAFAGIFRRRTKNETAEAIRKAGGKVTSTVSKKTTVLIAGEYPGSSLEKARALGVPVWDEEQLEAALEEGK